MTSYRHIRAAQYIVRSRTAYSRWRTLLELETIDKARLVLVQVKKNSDKASICCPNTNPVERFAIFYKGRIFERDFETEKLLRPAQRLEITTCVECGAAQCDCVEGDT